MPIADLFRRMLASLTLDELETRRGAAIVMSASPTEQTPARQAGWRLVLSDIEAEIAARHMQASEAA